MKNFFYSQALRILAQTWHHRLVARWQDEFNLDGPQIDYFKKAIQHLGYPALDIGCATDEYSFLVRNQGQKFTGVIYRPK